MLYIRKIYHILATKLYRFKKFTDYLFLAHKVEIVSEQEKQIQYKHGKNKF